jgi:Endopolygalacturonase
MHPLIFINGAKNVSITGDGVFNGNGKRWWDYIYDRRAEQKEPSTEIEKKFAFLNPDYKSQPGGGGGRQTQFLRPPLMQIYNSSDILLEGFTLLNSPFWTFHPVYSSNVHIKGVTVKNPYITPNTDGMDIESSKDVLIEDCLVDVGDDGIALKSGSGEAGIKANRPTENVTVRGCTVKQAHGGFVIGSETAAGFKDITVSGCTFLGTDRGIRIKTRRGRGGKIENIRISDIHMEDTICPITINMYYRCGSDEACLYSTKAQPITATTPSIENVLIENVHSTRSKAAGFIVGLPEAPIKNLTIKNSTLTVDDTDPKDFEIEMFNGIPTSSYKGIRVREAELNEENVIVNVKPPIQFE